jgi:FkbM family methyltransferase
MIKYLVKWIYGLIPAWILLRTPLSKFIHNKPLPSSVQSFEIKPTKTRLTADNSPIVRLAFWKGVSGYEPNELSLYIKLCARVNSVCEIGGNIGYFTIFGASANQKRYTVYEPLPYNFSLLKENIELNQLEFVECYNSAVVGNEDVKFIKLFTPKAESYGAATGGFIEGAESINRAVGTTHTVSAISSKIAISDFELIKIDVEGAEFEILSSAESQLAKSQSIILVEMRRGTTKLRRWITSYVGNYGHKIFVLSEYDNCIYEISVDKVADIVLQEEYGTRDIIICPKDKSHIVLQP